VKEEKAVEAKEEEQGKKGAEVSAGVSAEVDTTSAVARVTLKAFESELSNAERMTRAWVEYAGASARGVPLPLWGSPSRLFLNPGGLGAGMRLRPVAMPTEMERKLQQVHAEEVAKLEALRQRLQQPTTGTQDVPDEQPQQVAEEFGAAEIVRGRRRARLSPDGQQAQAQALRSGASPSATTGRRRRARSSASSSTVNLLEPLLRDFEREAQGAPDAPSTDKRRD
jgi:hypothetical protein